MEDTEFVKFQAIEAPKRTFFYQRADGTIFAAQEMEAGRFGKFYKLLGVGDGTAYIASIKASGVVAGSRIPKAQAQKILDDAFQAELEAARGKMAQPVFNSVVGLDGTPTRIFDPKETGAAQEHVLTKKTL